MAVIAMIWHDMTSLPLLLYALCPCSFYNLKSWDESYKNLWSFVFAYKKNKKNKKIKQKQKKAKTKTKQKQNKKTKKQKKNKKEKKNTYSKNWIKTYLTEILGVTNLVTSHHVIALVWERFCL